MSERDALQRYSIARWAAWLLLIGGAALATAIVALLVLTVADLYITGHGGAALGRPWISWGLVDMSRADVLFLGATLLATLVAAFGGRGLLRR